MGEAIRSRLQVQREGDLENSRHLSLPLWCQSRHPERRSILQPSDSVSSGFFHRLDIRDPLGNSLILSGQSLTNKRIRGTDYQNQSNSFAGSYRQNASHVFSSAATIRPLNFSGTALNSLEKNYNSLFKEALIRNMTNG